MRRLFLALLFAVASIVALLARSVSGTVVDGRGECVPFAAIYFKELHRGISADSEGRFQIELPEGEYCCRVSSLGYESIETQVEVSNEKETYNFELERRPLALEELNVTADGEENPADIVMRKVIARAPYYECTPDSFAAKVYVKGSGKITDTPGVFELSSDFRKEKDKMVNRLFVLEKVSMVEFGAPGNWNERVEAVSNTFPDELSIDMPVSLDNFYGKELFGSPSPLREGAFTYYSYKLEDYYEDDGMFINKISIKPRRKENGLFSGYLYVVDGDWCLSAADLHLSQGGLLDVHVVATFQQVEPGMWLLGSQSATCHVGVLGVKMTAFYTLSAQYSHIGSVPLRDGEVIPLTERGRHIADKITDIKQKDKLSKKDSYKLSALTAALMEENLSARQLIKRRSRYDLTYMLGSHSSMSDSMASCRDSAYWVAARSVPLDEEELESYRRHQEDTVTRKEDLEGGGVGEIIGNAIFGGSRVRLFDDKAWLNIGGLTSIWSGYNFVDGYKVGLGLSMGYDFNEGLSATISPSVYYDTARKAVTGSVGVQLDYAPLRKGRLVLSGGRVSADYNGETPESAAVIAIQSALFARNDVKLYDRANVTISNDIEIANGTSFSTGVSWERRRPLENHVEHSWFKKSPSPNVPKNDLFVGLPSVNDALTARIAVTYTPAAYYYIINGRKRYLRSRFPTFELAYTRGIGYNDCAPSYNRIDLSIEQEVELGIFNKIIYQLRGGVFLDADRLQFPDYKHFSATRFPLTSRRFADSFVLLDNYAYSTDSRYAEAGFTWQAPRMVLKQLPFLRDKNFSECLHLRSVVTHHRRPYSELGYSVNVFDVASVGVFTSWLGVDYRSACVSVSLPLEGVF